MSVTVVTQIQRVVVRGSGASYSDARVLAYLRSILTTNGDLLTVAAGTLARVGIGSSGHVLTVSGGAAVWAAPTGFANPMTAHGDLIIGGASGTPTRFPRGANGQILSVSGSTLAWIDAPTSYTDVEAIAAVAGEATDHQLIQRLNGTSLQGISLATIYDGAQDHIEALGDGVLVTAGGVLDNVVGATANHALLWNGTTWVAGAVPYSALSGVPSTFAPSSHTHTASEITDFATAWTTRLTALGSGATANDVLTWNGAAWAAAAPAAGMNNPMLTRGDIVYASATGSPATPARRGVGAIGTLLGSNGTDPVYVHQITSPPVIVGTAGTAITTYTATATGTVSSWGASGLPSGLSINSGTGAITGTPAAAGVSTVTLTATYADGSTAVKVLSVTVLAAASGGSTERIIGGVSASGTIAGWGCLQTSSASGFSVTSAVAGPAALNGVYEAYNSTGAKYWYNFAPFYYSDTDLSPKVALDFYWYVVTAGTTIPTKIWFSLAGSGFTDWSNTLRQIAAVIDSGTHGNSRMYAYFGPTGQDTGWAPTVNIWYRTRLTAQKTGTEAGGAGYITGTMQTFNARTGVAEHTERTGQTYVGAATAMMMAFGKNSAAGSSLWVSCGSSVSIVG